jgi:hypothetical protein
MFHPANPKNLQAHESPKLSSQNYYRKKVGDTAQPFLAALLVQTGSRFSKLRLNLKSQKRQQGCRTPNSANSRPP